MLSLAQKTAKAIYATVVTFLGTLFAALTTGQSLSDLDAKTWLAVTLATVVAGGGVYGLANKE